MKAYAEYFEENGLFYRRNTLLQFGESWDLIGSAVLANPGSAEPNEAVSKPDLASVSGFYKRYRVGKTINAENWHAFSIDSTMRFLEKIFSGWYVGKRTKLDGVIQLFNTFNIKNQNLQQAIDQLSVDSDLLFSYTIYKYFHDKPTYFGFSNAVLSNELLRNVAMEIFSNSCESVRSIYHDDFSENAFYHPMYINKAYKQSHFREYRDGVLMNLLPDA